MFLFLVKTKSDRGRRASLLTDIVFLAILELDGGTLRWIGQAELACRHSFSFAR